MTRTGRGASRALALPRAECDRPVQAVLSESPWARRLGDARVIIAVMRRRTCRHAALLFGSRACPPRLTNAVVESSRRDFHVFTIPHCHVQCKPRMRRLSVDSNKDGMLHASERQRMSIHAYSSPLCVMQLPGPHIGTGLVLIHGRHGAEPDSISIDKRLIFAEENYQLFVRKAYMTQYSVSKQSQGRSIRKLPPAQSTRISTGCYL